MEGLAIGQEYRLTVIDWDVAGNEGHYEYIYFVTNRPPVAGFDYARKPVWEGDTLQILDEAYDPDGDILDYEYVFTDPDGNTFTYTSQEPTHVMLPPGTWTVEQTVTDPYGERDTYAETIDVGELTLEGDVRHTDAWNEKRISYNEAKTGSPDNPRPYSWFWRGEKFVLEAETTDTQTATHALKVEVEMRDRNLRLIDATILTPDNAQRTEWIGEMYQEAFEELSDGDYTFVFHVTYSNGVEKEDAVTIRLQHHWTDFSDIHRIE